MIAILYWSGMGALVYGLLIAILYAGQRRLLYRPTPPPANMRPRPPFSAVFVRTADGLALRCWYAPARYGRLTIVYFHGNAGTLRDKFPRVRAFAEQGHGVLLVAYRGYSGNPGQPSEAGLYRDGRAALRWLARQGVPPGRTVVLGESLGTGVALEMARQSRVAGAVLVAPYTSIVAVAARRFPFVPVGLLLKDRFDSARKIAAVRAPILIVHGTCDRVIPERLGRELARRGSRNVAFLAVRGADHGDLATPLVLARLLAFLRELEIGARRSDRPCQVLARAARLPVAVTPDGCSRPSAARWRQARRPKGVSPP